MRKSTATQAKLPSSLCSEPDRGKRKAESSRHRSFKFLLLSTSSFHIHPAQNVWLAHVERFYHLWRGRKGNFDHRHVTRMVSASTEKPQNVVVVMDARKWIFSVRTTYDTMNLKSKIPNVDLISLIWWRANVVLSCTLKGHCHAIWQLFKKLGVEDASITFQNWWSSFVLKDYLKVLKLFPAAYRYGWHGWIRIETWKNWPIFSSVDATSSKSPQEFIMVSLLW